MEGMSESLFPTRWANENPPSLEKFTSDFADDYACAEYLAKKRWKSGFRCPRCGGEPRLAVGGSPMGMGMPGCRR